MYVCMYVYKNAECFLGQAQEATPLKKATVWLVSSTSETIHERQTRHGRHY